MGTELITQVETELKFLAPKFGDLLANSGLSVERMIRTIMVALERGGRILDCTQKSIIQCGATSAVLALEADGATGQFFMLPFSNRGTMIAQPCIGYKGYNTLAGRSGFTITGEAVYEGDEVFFDLGTGEINHKRPFGTGRSDRRVIGAWAKAGRPGFSPILKVMDIDELNDVRNKSPGFKAGNSPWNQPGVPLVAMYEKTVKRRLARSMPLNLMVRAAAMDEAHEERGLHAFMDPDRGLIVDGTAERLGEPQPQPEQKLNLSKPAFIIRTGDTTEKIMDSAAQWVVGMKERVDKLPMASSERLLDLNLDLMRVMEASWPEEVAIVREAFTAKIGRGD